MSRGISRFLAGLQVYPRRPARRNPASLPRPRRAQGRLAAKAPGAGLHKPLPISRGGDGTRMAQTTTLAGLRNMPGRAIIYMVSAAFLIIILDTAVKWLAKGAYSPFQIGFLRYVVGLGISAGIATRAGGIGTFRTRRPGGHLLRSVLNLTTMLTFYYALERLPLADCIAIGFASPLFTTALSVPILGEKVGPRRWLAVAIGFAGVLLVVQPTAAGIGLGAALALLSALCWSLTQVTS